ncbi:MAG: NUDIX hydrolase [Candidatus Nanopelagicales bacterium]
MAERPDEEWTAAVADGGEPTPTLKSEVGFEGKVWDVRTDTLEFGGQTIVRNIIIHPGAVGIVAIDDHDRVLLIRQYRHPVGMHIFEPPAGLLDVQGEPPAMTAQRELAEESGYEARTWHTLVDFLNSPGGSSEAIRIYLARDLTPIPGGRPYTGEAEEGFLPRAWVDLDEAKDLVLSGAVSGPTAVAGILAAWAARACGWQHLRPADAPWTMRESLLSTDRVATRFSKHGLA